MEKVIKIRDVKKPIVSVIIPTLNEEKYLEKTLISIRAQTFKGKYEIIVSDGGSKDKTIEIAKKYADKIVVTRKKGIALGRNLGAKYSKGKYLIFIDADTMMIPDTIENLIKELKKKKVVLVTCPVIINKYKVIENLMYTFYNNFSKGSIKLDKPQVAGMIMACKREAFEKIGGFNEKMKILEDYDFSERISKLGKVKMVESTMVLTSPRRIEKWGRTQSAIKYVGFYLGYLLTGKDWGSKAYKPVR